MGTRFMLRSNIPLIIAAGLSFAATASAANRLTPVTLSASPVLTTVVGHTNFGAPITVMTKKATVSYANLDLATRSGAAALMRRVKATAWAACEQLTARSPTNMAQTVACTRKAEVGALRQARLAVAVAHALRRNG